MARNPVISKGIRRYPKSAKFGKVAAGLKELPKKAAKKPTTVTKPFQGGERVVSVRKSRGPLTRRVKNPNKGYTMRAPTVRASITPGTVLILLAGRHRGKRVVALKSLSSGLVLISGPQKINGVPLRRVNQAYVIATKTKVDLKSAVKVADKIDDAYFATLKTAGAKAAQAAKAEASGDDKVDGKSVANKAIALARQKDQYAVDDAILADLKGKDDMLAYLRARFSLQKGQYPHKMTF
jgi:large subunit ribosomal protein L6e